MSRKWKLLYDTALDKTAPANVINKLRQENQLLRKKLERAEKELADLKKQA